MKVVVKSSWEKDTAQKAFAHAMNMIEKDAVKVEHVEWKAEITTYMAFLKLLFCRVEVEG